MKVTSATILFLSTAASANNDDRFNYRGTDGRDFGPEQWNRVQCDDVGECLGWPDSWELGVGWELKRNNCEWCPDSESGNDCSIHRQSPINLERTRSTTGHDPECYDYHWMAYQDGSCNWHDIVMNGYSQNENNFKINRHSLQIHQPIDEHGELQCGGLTGRRFPRLDYSKGFPDWWFLSHTEVTVPSEHTQGGKRYDAEVHLAHFYSVDHERKVGKVVLFLEADPDRERWDFLDKLICQWREVEEKARDECGLESVPAYPGCQNPTRDENESNLPVVDPYPFIDCDSVENSERMCKSSSCCEANRSTGGYCQNNVYDKYGDETVGSICWWCCPGKLLGPAEGKPTPVPFLEPTPLPSQVPSQVDLAPIKPYFGPTQDSDINSSTPIVYETTLEPIPISTLTSSPLAPVSVVVCSDYDGHPNIRLKRICEDGGCCDSVRSSTGHCHATYKFFGASMGSVCSDCCNPSKELAPPPPSHPIYPMIDCTVVDNPFRICKANSCCNKKKSKTDYCEDTYEEYGEIMGSICWHCCSEPKEVDPSVFPPSLPTLPVPAGPSTSPTPTHPDSSLHPTQIIPSTVVCSDYDGHPDIRLKQICEYGGCCDPVRSSTDHCHATYKFFGGTMESVCSDCCSPSKELAPLAPPHPIYPEIDCTTVKNPFRICKPTSCCNQEKSTTNYCKDTYEEYGELMGSICWHCCSEPKEVDTSVLPPSPPYTPLPTYDAVPSSAPSISARSILPTMAFTTAAPNTNTYGPAASPFPSESDTPRPTHRFGKTFSPTVSPSASVNTVSGHPSDVPSGIAGPTLPEVSSSQPSGRTPSVEVVSSNPSGVPSNGSATPVSIGACREPPTDGCSICGPESCIGNADAIFSFPGQPAVPCGVLQEIGYNGLIPLDQCIFLPSLITDCACEPTSGAAADPPAEPTGTPASAPPATPLSDPLPSPVMLPSPLETSPIGDSTATPNANTYGPAASPFPSESDTPRPTHRFGKTFSPTVSPSTLSTVSSHPSDVPSGIAGPTLSEVSSNQPSGRTPSVEVVSSNPSGVSSDGSAAPVSIGACREPPADGCSICGPESCVGNADAIFSFPGQPAVPCGVLQEIGYNGLIPLDQCIFLPTFITDCACGSSSDAAAVAEPTDTPTLTLATPLPGSLVVSSPAVPPPSPPETSPSSNPPSSADSDKVSARRGLLPWAVHQQNEEHSSIVDSVLLDTELTESTDVLLPSGIWASDIIMDPANFKEPDENLEKEYIASIEAYRKRQEEEANRRRLLQQEEEEEDPSRRRLSEGSSDESGDNYINVPYSPYEWLREVRTEYYYRYEGTQMVPPCYETVHYRIMKDPIRIHPDQLAELERLLAWRIAPKGSEFQECERDTAGRERSDGQEGADAVDLNRPLQSYHNIHRKVFCECGDWTSKWQEDRDWCEQLDDDTRLHTQPYNFPTSDGFNMQ